jgi:hypothetical protein
MRKMKIAPSAHTRIESMKLEPKGTTAAMSSLLILGRTKCAVRPHAIPRLPRGLKLYRQSRGHLLPARKEAASAIAVGMNGCSHPGRYQLRKTEDEISEDKGRGTPFYSPFEELTISRLI